MEAPSQFLKTALCDRVARNRAYSLRAFARDLGVSHSYLSLVMSDKKRISAQQAAWMADILGIDIDDKDRFIASTFSQPRRRVSKKPPQNFMSLEIDKVQCLAGWQHWAILDLTLTDDFRPNHRWIAKRLGISASKVSEAVGRLERLGLLKKEGGTWKKSESFLSLPTSRSHSCLRQLHRELILRSLGELAHTGRKRFEKRCITGAIMAVNPERLEEAKKRVAKFKRGLIRYLSEGNCTEVYQLGVQLVPVTKRKKA